MPLLGSPSMSATAFLNLAKSAGGQTTLHFGVVRYVGSTPVVAKWPLSSAATLPCSPISICVGFVFVAARIRLCCLHHWLGPRRSSGDCQVALRPCCREVCSYRSVSATYLAHSLRVAFARLLPDWVDPSPAKSSASSIPTLAKIHVTCLLSSYVLWV